MGPITILGLGPGDPGSRTVATVRALAAARRIVLRTSVHPGLDDLTADPRVVACDDLYETGATFEAVYAGVVARVIDEARAGDVVFAVPGHPLFGERAVSALITRCERLSIPYAIAAAVSALDVVSLNLREDFLVQQPVLVDAVDLAAFVERQPFSGSLLNIVASRPCLVSQVYSRAIAASVKIALSRVFPEEHVVKIVSGAGIGGAPEPRAVPLYELDRQAVDHLTSVWVPALAPLDATRAASSLHQIAARLRAPDGCPWDRKQTHASLREAVIEEAYEVVDAIDEGDAEHLSEELGDLLLQVALHAQIAEEAGDFSIEDVYDNVNRKLVRRHPHVFGDANAKTADEVVQTWQGVKRQERAARGVMEAPVHPLDLLPRSMPALTKAARLLTKHQSAPGAARGAAGVDLLSILETMVEAGLDPETELLAALRGTTWQARVDQERAEERTAVGAVAD